MFCLLLVLCYDKVGLTIETAVAVSFLIVAVWWVLMTVPLLKSYCQTHFVPADSHPVRASFRRLGHVWAELKQKKKILLFLVAFFFYIDGVYTIIDMATAYGTALGLDSTGLLLALLVTQIVAFPSALIFGRLSRRISAAKLIRVCIIAYFCIAVYGLFLVRLVQFWILAVCVGLFQGAIQSLSRSYFAKLIPAEQSGEYFGIYDICGKGASLVGTSLVALVSQISGSVNTGVGALAVMFLLGAVFFLMTEKWADTEPEPRIN